MGKKWYESKTLWVNTLAIVGGVLTALSGEMATGGSITVAGVINIILRIVTTESLSK